MTTTTNAATGTTAIAVIGPTATTPSTTIIGTDIGR